MNIHACYDKSNVLIPTYGVLRTLLPMPVHSMHNIHTYVGCTVTSAVIVLVEDVEDRILFLKLLIDYNRQMVYLIKFTTKESDILFSNPQCA